MKKILYHILFPTAVLLIFILSGCTQTENDTRKAPAPESAPEAVVDTLPANPGFPTVPAGDTVIHHTYYTLSYNERYEQPDWVMYKLVKDSLLLPKNPRKDHFRSDPEVHSGSASPADYKKSGYDRGHLLPAAAMSWSKSALSETFFMSNMSPQAPQFNRGIWKQLESRVRDWAVEDGELYVITGPVLKGDLPTIGANEVAVPQYYYKVILDYREPEVKAIAFVLSNEKHTEPLQTFAVPIDSVEHLTGIDFFAPLPDTWEDSLETQVDISAWFAPLP